MNHLPGFLRQHLAALRTLVVFTVLTGVIYPLAMWGIGQAVFNRQANGSLILYHGRVVGSSLLCQEFVTAKGSPLPQYFQPRPSYAINPAGPNPQRNYGCDPTNSSASNLGPTNSVLIQAIRQRQQQISAFDHVAVSKIPADAVTASGSGLDPGITPANAAIQVNRVATARHVSPAAIRALVARYTTGRSLGFLGEPSVNVLQLNLALDARYPG
jgi:potassium-transporting ATPase KdpC subunit